MAYPSLKIQDLTEFMLSREETKNETILWKERFIHNFLSRDLHQIVPVLRDRTAAPGDDPLALVEKLLLRVREKALKEIKDCIYSIVQGKIDFSILERTGNPLEIPLPEFKERLLRLLDLLLTHHEVRFHFNGLLLIFRKDILERYVRAVFQRQSYLYHEILYNEKLRMEPEEYVSYLKILLLLKNIVHLTMKKNGRTRPVFLSEKDDPLFLKRFFPFLEKLILDHLPGLSSSFIQTALKANVRSDLVEPGLSSPRLLFILNHRYQHAGPGEKADPLAEPPDKSWFYVSRKNADYFGYDRNILDELFQIAQENNW